MLLKLKVRQDQDTKEYFPTGTFYFNSFMDGKGIQEALSVAHKYIKDKDVSKVIVNGNEVHLKIKDGVASFDNTIDITAGQIEDIVLNSCGEVRADVFGRTRDQRFFIPRAVIICAVLYFKKLGYSEVGRLYGYNHATVFHIRNKAIPSLMYSDDRRVTELVKALSDVLLDDGFTKYCSTYGIPNRKKVYTAKVHNFRGVRMEDRYVNICWKAFIENKGKEVYLGRYDTPEEAAKAYNNYAIKNGLNRKLNEV